MYGNRLQTLGPEIGKLGNLKTLGLSENQITHLPGRLFVEVVVVLLFKCGFNIEEAERKFLFLHWSKEFSLR